MMPFNRRSLLTGTMAAMAVGLGACGSSPQATQSTSAPAPSGNSQEPAPTTSPTLPVCLSSTFRVAFPERIF